MLLNIYVIKYSGCFVENVLKKVKGGIGEEKCWTHGGVLAFGEGNENKRGSRAKIVEIKSAEYKGKKITNIPRFQDSFNKTVQ